MLIIAIIFIPYAILLLYSRDFLPSCDYVIYAAVGMMFRFAAVLVAHIFLAKGASKLYIFNELASCSYTLLLNILGYKLYGLSGLGLSFGISYVLYLVQVLFLTYHNYNFSYSAKFCNIFGIQLSLVLATLFVFLFIGSPMKYAIGMILFFVSAFLSLRGLDSRIGLAVFIKNKLFQERKNRI